MTNQAQDVIPPFPEEGKANYYVVGVGREITINDNLAIQFVKVISDGRCPTGVMCVWAGRAEVETLVTTGGSGIGRTKKDVVFKAGGINRWPPTGEIKSGAIRTMEIDGTQVTLMDLLPYPAFDSVLGRVQSIDPSAYRALFYFGAHPPCFDTGPPGRNLD